MFRRYSDVSGLMETIATVRELQDFLIFVLTEIGEEKTFEYYLHKSIFSDMSYADFKKEQEIAKPLSDKEQKEIIDYSKHFISIAKPESKGVKV